MIWHQGVTVVWAIAVPMAIVPRLPTLVLLFQRGFSLRCGQQFYITGVGFSTDGFFENVVFRVASEVCN